MTEQREQSQTTGGKEKQAYVAPVLTHLGSVRELTAGSPGSSMEGGFPRPRTM